MIHNLVLFTKIYIKQATYFCVFGTFQCLHCCEEHLSLKESIKLKIHSSLEYCLFSWIPNRDSFAQVSMAAGIVKYQPALFSYRREPLH